MEAVIAGTRIREARRARGLTQADLAAAVGVSRSAVAQWETDRAGQVTGNLARIATVLGVPVAQLIAADATAGMVTTDGSELALVRLYRDCSQADRQLLLRTAVRLARNQTTIKPPASTKS